jgi:outer membrane protein assembly factor BamB
LKLVVAALAWMICLSPMTMVVSGEGENTTIAVLFDSGNGLVTWSDVKVPGGIDAFNVTILAADALGLDLNDSFYDQWQFWTWNSAGSSWGREVNGPFQALTDDTSAVAWVNTTSTYAPLATPGHRYPWTSFRHDSLNTGAQRTGNATNSIELLWDYDLGNGAIDSSILGANGKIYAVTNGILNESSNRYETGSKVFCLDRSGIVWSASTGKGDYQVGSALLCGDLLVVPSGDGKVYAYYAANGSGVWTFDTKETTHGVISSPLGYNDKVLIAAYDGTIHSLNAEDGTEAWNESVGASIYSSSPAMIDGTIYIGSEDGKLHALAADGSGEKWNISIGSKIRGSPLLSEEGVVVTYANATGGGVAAVSYAGDLLWQTSIGGSPASPVLSSEGYIVMVGDGMTMVDFSGKVLWTRPLGTSWIGAAATVFNGTIFAVTNEAKSRAVAVSLSGLILWEQVLNPAEYALCSPTVIDNVLYVASDNGHIYAFSLDDKGGSSANSVGNTDTALLLIGGVVAAVLVSIFLAVYIKRRK